MQDILDSPIEYLKGVGPKRGELLRKELQIHTFRDLLFQFPFRYVDKTRFHKIRELEEDSGAILLRGILRRLDLAGEGRKRRLSGQFRDDTGAIELVWFSGVHWLQKQLVVGQEYVVYGKIQSFRDGWSISHPEMEIVSEENTQAAASFAPVYPSTEKLNAQGLDSKARRRLVKALLEKLTPDDLPENLPEPLVQAFRFPKRWEAFQGIHFPKSEEDLERVRNRLKFEELFYLQLRLLRMKYKRKEEIRGYVFEKVGDGFNEFYTQHLPFQLTEAQKRVIKEIRRDLGSGIQMNRLLQGDVGSGKTMVALLCMLLALDNGFQAAMMAPTEILAQQHFLSITGYLSAMDIRVAYLSGSIRGKARQAILDDLASGAIQILIGTHALLEDPVVFQRLGLAITDEQHRFGVAQRAKLWQKSHAYPPHILVMTATPIPRTLAMTLYGDLDVSVIDELPPGRKEVITQHRNENHRIRIFGFMKEQIALGRQVYVVYPMIEESEKADLKNLMEGYEAIQREFPLPHYQISIVHGRMKPAEKDYEMQRFVQGITQIMVATTVIEVGVNVPNASVMIVENTERFGLSQLHQLRGRVGRGADQSYCILMSGFKLSADGKARIRTLVETNNGFEIAEADLRLRGPGDLQGTQQSGLVQLYIADLAKDGKILQAAREMAERILGEDPQLQRPENDTLRHFLAQDKREWKGWSRIS
ncbi:MAG: ATP-dependent DNA helicase RecG [Haliscomenobacter sp.]|nr:ATP-dependent DNA helicase RecG [Haliscomenobacter sp.]